MLKIGVGVDDMKDDDAHVLAQYKHTYKMVSPLSRLRSYYCMQKKFSLGKAFCL